jgi:hypothetical protein
LRTATAQTNVKNYNKQLCRLVEVHEAEPSLIVSHQLPLLSLLAALTGSTIGQRRAAARARSEIESNEANF